MLRQITRTAGALLSAGLLSLCFPSGNTAWLAWVALIPLILSVERDALPIAFVRGYAAGFLFFILTIFWVHHVTALGLICMSLYLALYWGAFAAGVSFTFSWTPERRVFFLACLWTALEYARANALTGFGWSSLAHTQAAFIPSIQLADVTGTYGLSFIMVVVNTSVAAWMRLLIYREAISLGLWRVTAYAAALLVIAALYGVLAQRAIETAFWSAGKWPAAKVALIQGNVSLSDYWDPLRKSQVVEKYLTLSRQAMAMDKADLVVWPETSFPQFIWDHPDLFEKVRAFARENRVPVLLGAVTRAGEDYFNSAVLIDRAGALGQVYNKQHLVLFGEYIPLREQFPWLQQLAPIDDFTAGKGNVLFTMGGKAAFSSLVCFEDTIPGLARGAALGGADFLVNITNDAWFGASRQRRMHLDNAAFRAVETRRTLVRATNTGMTCKVFPSGQVAACVGDDRGRQAMPEGFMVVEVPLHRGSETFYTKFGDVFALLCFPVILGMLIFIRREGQDVRSSACF